MTTPLRSSSSRTARPSRDSRAVMFSTNPSWSVPHPPTTPEPSDDWEVAEQEAEEHGKDLATFKFASRRRVVSSLAIGPTAAAASLLGWISVPLWLIAAIFAGVLVMNTVLMGVARSATEYRWWLRYAFALFDASIISVAVFALGNAGVVSIYYLAVVPYSFDRGQRLGRFVSLACALEFVAAMWLHTRYIGGTFEPVWVLGTAFVFTFVSFQIVRIPAKLIGRIRRTRELMAQAERGNLMARADARYNDELGYLERSYNSMLGQLSDLMGAIQREADETASLAEELAASSLQLNAAGTEFASTAHALTTQLHEQQRFTESGAKQTHEALGASERLRERAGEMESEASSLMVAAGSSRDAIDRASQTLVSVGEGVRESAGMVRQLGDLSDRVGEFVTSVSSIARQTNLLALNAAIEAARAGEHGKGFAVVAEEVRKLAEESARAAGQISTTITDVRKSIDAVVKSMAEDEVMVRDVGQVAHEANSALGSMLGGIQSVAAVITDAATVSRAQAEAMRSLSGVIRGVQDVAVEAARRSSNASALAGEQTTSLKALSTMSGELAQLADRLRSSISRFSVTTLPHTREMTVTR